MSLTSNTLKKYVYLHNYKNVIIALILRTKFNGQEGVCRLIQSYIWINLHGRKYITIFKVLFYTL